MAVIGSSSSAGSPPPPTRPVQDSLEALHKLLRATHKRPQLQQQDETLVLLHPDFLSELRKGHPNAVSYARRRLSLLIDVALGRTAVVERHRAAYAASQGTSSAGAAAAPPEAVTTGSSPIGDDGEKNRDSFPDNVRRGGGPVLTPAAAPAPLTPAEVAALATAAVRVICGKSAPEREGTLDAQSSVCGPVWDATTARDFFRWHRGQLVQICSSMSAACERLEKVVPKAMTDPVDHGDGRKRDPQCCLQQGERARQQGLEGLARQAHHMKGGLEFWSSSDPKMHTPSPAGASTTAKGLDDSIPLPMGVTSRPEPVGPLAISSSPSASSSASASHPHASVIGGVAQTSEPSATMTNTDATATATAEHGSQTIATERMEKPISLVSAGSSSPTARSASGNPLEVMWTEDPNDCFPASDERDTAVGLVADTAAAPTSTVEARQGNGEERASCTARPYTGTSTLSPVLTAGVRCRAAAHMTCSTRPPPLVFPDDGPPPVSAFRAATETSTAGAVANANPESSGGGDSCVGAADSFLAFLDKHFGIIQNALVMLESLLVAVVMENAFFSLRLGQPSLLAPDATHVAGVGGGGVNGGGAAAGCRCYCSDGGGPGRDDDEECGTGDSDDDGLHPNHRSSYGGGELGLRIETDLFVDRPNILEEFAAAGDVDIDASGRHSLCSGSEGGKHGDANGNHNSSTPSTDRGWLPTAESSRRNSELGDWGSGHDVPGSAAASPTTRDSCPPLAFAVEQATRAFVSVFLSLTTVQHQLTRYSELHERHHGLCVAAPSGTTTAAVAAGVDVCSSGGDGGAKKMSIGAAASAAAATAAAAEGVPFPVHASCAGVTRAALLASAESHGPAEDCELCQRFNQVEDEMSARVEATMRLLKLTSIAIAAHDTEIAEVAIAYIDRKGVDFTAQATMLLAHVLTPELLAAHPTDSRGGRAIRWILSFVFGGCDGADVEKMQRRRQRARAASDLFSIADSSLNSSLNLSSPRATSNTADSGWGSDGFVSPVAGSDDGGSNYSFGSSCSSTEPAVAEVQQQQQAAQLTETYTAIGLRVEYILAACFTRCQPLMTVIGCVAESDAYDCGVVVAKAVLQYAVTLSHTSARLIRTPLLTTRWSTPFTEAMMRGLSELAKLHNGEMSAAAAAVVGLASGSGCDLASLLPAGTQNRKKASHHPSFSSSDSESAPLGDNARERTRGRAQHLGVGHGCSARRRTRPRNRSLGSPMDVSTVRGSGAFARSSPRRERRQWQRQRYAQHHASNNATLKEAVRAMGAYLQHTSSSSTPGPTTTTAGGNEIDACGTTSANLISSTGSIGGGAATTSKRFAIPSVVRLPPLARVYMAQRRQRFHLPPHEPVTGTTPADRAESASNRTHRRNVALHWAKCVVLSARTLIRSGIIKVPIPREHYETLSSESKRLQGMLSAWFERERQLHGDAQAVAAAAPTQLASTFPFSTLEMLESSKAARVPALAADRTTDHFGSSPVNSDAGGGGEGSRASSDSAVSALNERYQRAFVQSFCFGKDSLERFAESPFVNVPIHEVLFASCFSILDAVGDVLLCEEPRLNSIFVNELVTLLYELRLSMLEAHTKVQLITSPAERFRSLSQRDAAMLDGTHAPWELLFPAEYAVLMTRAFRCEAVIARWRADLARDPNHPTAGYASLLYHIHRELVRYEYPTNQELLISRATLRLLLGATARDEAGDIHGNVLHVDDLDVAGTKKEDVVPRLGVTASMDAMRGSHDDMRQLIDRQHVHVGVYRTPLQSGRNSTVTSPMPSDGEVVEGGGSLSVHDGAEVGDGNARGGGGAARGIDRECVTRKGRGKGRCDSSSNSCRYGGAGDPASADGKGRCHDGSTGSRSSFLSSSGSDTVNSSGDEQRDGSDCESPLMAAKTRRKGKGKIAGRVHHVDGHSRRCGRRSRRSRSGRGSCPPRSIPGTHGDNGTIPIAVSIAHATRGVPGTDDDSRNGSDSVSVHRVPEWLLKINGGESSFCSDSLTASPLQAPTSGDGGSTFAADNPLEAAPNKDEECGTDPPIDDIISRAGACRRASGSDGGVTRVKPLFLPPAGCGRGASNSASHGSGRALDGCRHSSHTSGDSSDDHRYGHHYRSGHHPHHNHEHVAANHMAPGCVHHAQPRAHSVMIIGTAAELQVMARRAPKVWRLPSAQEVLDRANASVLAREPSLEAALRNRLREETLDAELEDAEDAGVAGGTPPFSKAADVAAAAASATALPLDGADKRVHNGITNGGDGRDREALYILQVSLSRVAAQQLLPAKATTALGETSLTQNAVEAHTRMEERAPHFATADNASNGHGQDGGLEHGEEDSRCQRRHCHAHRAAIDACSVCGGGGGGCQDYDWSLRRFDPHRPATWTVPIGLLPATRQTHGAGVVRATALEKPRSDAGTVKTEDSHRNSTPCTAAAVAPVTPSREPVTGASVRNSSQSRGGSSGDGSTTMAVSRRGTSAEADSDALIACGAEGEACSIAASGTRAGRSKLRLHPRSRPRRRAHDLLGTVYAGTKAAVGAYPRQGGVDDPVPVMADSSLDLSRMPNARRLLETTAFGAQGGNRSCFSFLTKPKSLLLSSEDDSGDHENDDSVGDGSECGLEGSNTRHHERRSSWFGWQPHDRRDHGGPLSDEAPLPNSHSTPGRLSEVDAGSDPSTDRGECVPLLPQTATAAAAIVRDSQRERTGGSAPRRAPRHVATRFSSPVTVDSSSSHGCRGDGDHSVDGDGGCHADPVVSGSVAHRAADTSAASLAPWMLVDTSSTNLHGGGGCDVDSGSAGAAAVAAAGTFSMATNVSVTTGDTAAASATSAGTTPFAAASDGPLNTVDMPTATAATAAHPAAKTPGTTSTARNHNTHTSGSTASHSNSSNAGSPTLLDSSTPPQYRASPLRSFCSSERFFGSSLAAVIRAPFGRRPPSMRASPVSAVSTASSQSSGAMIGDSLPPAHREEPASPAPAVATPTTPMPARPSPTLPQQQQQHRWHSEGLFPPPTTSRAQPHRSQPQPSSHLLGRPTTSNGSSDTMSDIST